MCNDDREQSWIRHFFKERVAKYLFVKGSKIFVCKGNNLHCITNMFNDSKVSDCDTTKTNKMLF